jgi:hypothetical protein
MSWLDDFKRDDGDGPPDGAHTAWLERAVLRDTKSGKAIKCEWRTTDMAYYWESWHNTGGGGKQRTQQLLGDLGIDLGAIANESQLEDELALRENATFVVKVSHSQDGRFINTAVLERTQGVQTGLPVGAPAAATRPAPDVPIDTRDLPESPPAATAAGDLFGDDDIPF